MSTTVLHLIKYLSIFQVAWVQVDTQTILTIHNTVITRNPRVGLSHEGQTVYRLHLKDVTETDRGWYMCQINTDPMINKMGFLQVVGQYIGCNRCVYID